MPSLDLQVFWDNGLAIRLGSYFKATPSTSDNGPADDVPPVAMIFHAPKVMLCARPVDLKATEQHFIRDEQLVFTLHEVEVTPLREGGIGPCASGAKIIFQQVCIDSIWRVSLECYGLNIVRRERWR